MGISEFLAKPILNRIEIIQRLGEVQHVQFNKTNRIITLEILLKGEETNTTFHLYYAIDNSDFIIQKITTEKKWFNAALEYLLQKEIKIPLQNPTFSKILNFLI